MESGRLMDTLGERETQREREQICTFLGDAEDRPVSEAFRSAQVTTILGDATLDLHDITPARRSPRLDIFVLLGDAKIRVPPDWNVRTECSRTAGGLQGRAPLRETPAATLPELVIPGMARLGDIKVIE